MLFTNYYADSLTLPKANVGIQQHDESDPRTAIVFTCILQHDIETKQASRNEHTPVCHRHCKITFWHCSMLISPVIHSDPKSSFYISPISPCTSSIFPHHLGKTAKNKDMCMIYYLDGTAKHNQGWGTLLALQSFHCQCQTIHAI